jgi:hypothetical protein
MNSRVIISPAIANKCMVASCGPAAGRREGREDETRVKGEG